MKIHRVTLQKNLLIDTVLASVIVQQAPKLINKYLLGTTSQLSGTTLEIAGGAAAYLVGMLFGKNDIANIGIALAGADILNTYISPLFLGSSSTPPTPGTGDYSNNPYKLKDYNNSFLTTNYSQYESIYN